MGTFGGVPLMTGLPQAETQVGAIGRWDILAFPEVLGGQRDPKGWKVLAFQKDLCGI